MPASADGPVSGTGMTLKLYGFFGFGSFFGAGDEHL